MKRKVAFLLAALMALSVAPVNVFAASTNRVTKTPVIAANSLLFEPGVLGTTSALVEAGENDDDAEWYVDGSDLVLPLQENIAVGDLIRIQLTNADWYFQNPAGVADLDAAKATRDLLNSTISNLKDVLPSLYANDVDANNTLTGTQSLTMPKANSSSGYAGTDTIKETYLFNRGLFYPDANNDISGTYIRLPRKARTSNTSNGAATNWEIPYRLEVSSADTAEATLEVLAINTGAIAGSFPSDTNFANVTAGYITDTESPVYTNIGAGVWEIRIPLVSLTYDEDTDIQVEVFSGNISGISNYKAIYATAAKSNTKTTIASVVTARDEWNLDRVTISELKPGTLRYAENKGGDAETIALVLPYGYHWLDKNKVKVSLQAGLAWRDGKTGSKDSVKSTDNNNLEWWMVDYGNEGTNTTGDKITGSTNTSSKGTVDDTVLLLWFPNGLRSSTQLAGKIYIDGLTVYADDTAALPTGDGAIDIKMAVDGSSYITEEEITVAQRKDWTIGLKTTSSAPTLVSGRYNGVTWSGVTESGSLDVDDATHKTAKVQFYENTANSWWGNRTTVFSLPATNDSTVKGAKFRVVKVDQNDNFEQATGGKNGLENYTYTSAFYGRTPKAGYYVNDNEKHGDAYGYITVDNNKITLSNMRVKSGKKAVIDFEFWVSIELGFAEQYGGELKLSIDPSSTSIPTTMDSANLPSVVIAKVVDPIKVSTKVSNLKIGYQYQDTADIQIVENGAGYLQRDKKVQISISDLIVADLQLTPTATVKVTDGDLKIKDVSTANSSGFASQNGGVSPSVSATGEISFAIDRASTKASTITISNMGVRMDRNIPVTNRNAYQALVWGTAVAENYGLKDPSGHEWRSDFNTAGISAAYVNVVTAAPDDAGEVLSQEVRVPIGESYYLVNGISKPMDAAAYISSQSNSTMVPIRFVANAFGLSDDKISWDDSTKTVTIVAPSRIIQFKLGEAKMWLNNAPMTLTSPDGLPVSPEIKNDRMYIPFRALGTAFSVPVDWEADTQTAIYNKGANSNSAS